MITVLTTVVAAYLLGSINFAVIFTKLFTKQDIRDLGSGNAGTTNTMREVGALPGILTFLGDALKGFVASGMGYIFFDYLSQNGYEWLTAIYGAYVCGVACMMGHMFPIFFGFKGGKGVAVSVGIFVVCSWQAILIGLGVFALCLLISKFVSVSSLLATVTVVCLSVVFNDSNSALWPQVVMSVIMGTAVFLKHSENIKRLISGEENKIGSKRSKK